MATESEFTEMQSTPTRNEYSKSNILINAQYKGSLMMNKLMAISFAYPDRFCDVGNGTIVFEMSISEISDILHRKGGSLYDDISSAASSLSGYTIGYNDREAKCFNYSALITETDCRDGVLKIYYNAKFRNEIQNLTKHFTKLRLDVMTSFKSVHAFRSYENLLSKCYAKYAVGENDDEHYVMSYSVGEIKMVLGIIDVTDKKIKKALENKSGNIDYDYISSLAKDQSYSRYNNFHARVLLPAINEINSISEKYPDVGIHVAMATKKEGLGGKVYRLEFDVIRVKQRNDEDIVENIELSETEKAELLDYILDELPVRANFSEARKIAEVAKYNKSKIKNAIEIAKEQGELNNVIGFIIAAINDGYKQTKSKSNSDFEQHRYDFDELESQIIAS